MVFVLFAIGYKSHRYNDGMEFIIEIPVSPSGVLNEILP